MKLLVIGAGLIGKEIIKYHIDRGDEVFWLDNESNQYLNYANIPGERLGQNIDLAWFLKFNSAVVSIQASLVSIGQSTANPQRFLNENIGIVSKIIQACKDSGRLCRIIHSSSMGCYGEPTLLPTPETHQFNPISFYGVSKAAQEAALKAAHIAYGMAITNLRYFSVHGKDLSLDNPNTGILNFMVKQAKTGRIEINDTGLQTRDIIDVRDVAAAHYLAVHRELPDYSSMNIGTGQFHTLKLVAEMIRTKMGKDIEIFCNGKKRVGDIISSQADITLAKSLLGWEPQITLAQMVDEYLNEKADLH